MILYDGIAVLTVQQPWATAIALNLKDVENRTWKPRRPLPFDLAIHAGLATDTRALRHMPIGFPTVGLPHGCIIAVCRVVNIVHIEDWPEEDDLWATGPLCWMLEDIVQITPVYVRGRQGLWTYRSSEVTAWQTTESQCYG